MVRTKQRVFLNIRSIINVVFGEIFSNFPVSFSSEEAQVLSAALIGFIQVTPALNIASYYKIQQIECFWFKSP
jgi:hypothetical protein